MRPYPLAYPACLAQHGLSAYVTRSLAAFGGIRRTHTIGRELNENLCWLEGGGWTEVLHYVRELERADDAKLEREAAEHVAAVLVGFGPKQSRNLLQSLGLTRYEIPVDSRVTKWLNGFGFPLKLSSSALSDTGYYNLVSDGFQALCSTAGIPPCLMDAAIFASYDPS